MSTARVERREVPADLVEATPGNGGLAIRPLAAPLLLFLLWLWVDFFAVLSPLPWYWVDAALAAALFLVLLVPVGWAAYQLVTAAPRLFQNAGWDVQPLEPVREAELYTVRYTFRGRRRAPNTLQRQWLRAGAGLGLHRDRRHPHRRSFAGARVLQRTGFWLWTLSEAPNDL